MTVFISRTSRGYQVRPSWQLSQTRYFSTLKSANVAASEVAKKHRSLIALRGNDGQFEKQDRQFLPSKLEYSNHLSPIFKWTGGKRREIKHFESFFPSFVKEKSEYTYVEPFSGAAAVFWYLNNTNGKNILNDFDAQVINFYKIFSIGSSSFVSKLREIGKITDHDELEAVYYEQRNKDKDGGLAKVSETEQAIRFFVVNQLAFSGMRRFNSKGEFNVPFGHYKGLNSDVINNAEHKELLGKTSFLQGDFEKVMKDNDTDNTFQFLDPPYTRVFKEYSSDA